MMFAMPVIDAPRLLVTIACVGVYAIPLAWLIHKARIWSRRRAVDLVYEWADGNGLEIVDLTPCGWFDPITRDPYLWLFDPWVWDCNNWRFRMTVKDSNHRLKRGIIAVGSPLLYTRDKQCHVAWEPDRER